MTALAQYQRLECVGIWRAAPGDDRQEVVLSFGDATLVIADGSGLPLAHWSLPAIRRLNPGTRPALFAPGPDEGEELEVADDLMIDAVETVRRAVLRRRPRPPRLRRVMLGLSIAGCLALAVFWLPDALVGQTLKLVPQVKRAEIGMSLLGLIQQKAGPTCRNPLGTAALSRLRVRVLGSDSPVRVVVTPAALSGALVLPGAVVMVPRDLVERQDDPAVLAGYLLAAVTARGAADPLGAVLRDAGLPATLQLLGTGDLPSGALTHYAGAVLTAPRPAPGTSALLQAMATAKVPASPYARAAKPGNAEALIAGDPATGADFPPVLSDADWVALQGICQP
ncbi:MAG: hypothetical protein GC146_00765 [Limimaricola sp.]|uniref:hypothetical protein n=1 Tax=Limimaricola sp. TaxID=2211665 RepID=UPI001D24B8B7|nr:hypothetical protein [Limimaricola sp.]MBI1415728.1 hypothetical protein [Limimaricola sp.]